MGARSRLEADQLKPTLQVGIITVNKGLMPHFLWPAGMELFLSSNHYHDVGVLFSMPQDFYFLPPASVSEHEAAHFFLPSENPFLYNTGHE